MRSGASWRWTAGPAVAYAIVAFVGGALLDDGPDWVIILVALGAGIVIFGGTRLLHQLFHRRGTSSTAGRSPDA